MKILSLFLKSWITLCGLFVLLSGAGHKTFAQRPFIITMETGGFWIGDNQIQIQGRGAGYRIVWENTSDSTIKGEAIGTDTTTTITLPEAGTYQLKISGGNPAFHRITFDGLWDGSKLKKIEQWGDIVWSTMEGAFTGTGNMTCSATDAPNLSQVTSMKRMFLNCVNFNSEINHWDTRHVTDMSFLFSGASSFNQPLNAWNTSNVTNMAYMFANTNSFNQSLNSWDVRKVTHLSGMFHQAKAFNQPINSWRTNNLMYMNYMFAGASSFNQPLDSLNTSNVVDMNDIFAGASSFNQPLNAWNTSNVTNMYKMFDGASSFNQPLNAWNTSNVIDMRYMFANTNNFNQSLNSWDVRKVAYLSDMFSHARAFNQPINNWRTNSLIRMNHMFAGASSFNQPLDSLNTSNVADMSYIFAGASSFNQPLNAWKTSNVTNMSYMFYKAYAFDQTLAGWDISEVRNMSAMLDSCGMSIPSYDQTLISWAAQTVQGHVTVGADGLKFCQGRSARISLMSSPRNWAFIGDSQTTCAPEIDLWRGGIAMASGSTFDMGTVNVGSASGYHTLTIQNTGTRSLILHGVPKVQLQGTDLNDFTIIQHQLESPIAPGNSQVFEIRFNPTKKGTRQASLVISNNDTNENPYIIHLTGQGKGVPNLYISQNGTEVPSSSTFDMGQAFNKFEFIVENTGGGDLIFGGPIPQTRFVQISGLHAQDFKVVKISPINILPPEKKAAFILQFSPTADGTRQATATIYSNDPNEGTYVIHLIGNKLWEEAKLQVSPNPATHQLTLSGKQWQGQVVNIDIRNTQGRPIASQTIKQAQDKITLDVSKYKAGWYLLTINFNGTCVKYRFLKR